MNCVNSLGFDFVSNEVTINFNVFCPLVKTGFAASCIADLLSLNTRIDMWIFTPRSVNNPNSQVTSDTADAHCLDACLRTYRDLSN